jgi:hypothetical protein
MYVQADQLMEIFVPPSASSPYTAFNIKTFRQELRDLFTHLVYCIDNNYELKHGLKFDNRS